MNDKEKQYLERLKKYIDRHFKGYCIYVHVIKDEQMNGRVSVEFTLHDASRLELPAMILDEDNLSSLAECLEVNRNKIMMIRDQPM